MTRVAIPRFRSRISPVFDTCTRVLLIDLENNREVGRQEIYLNGMSMSERVTVLKNTNIQTIICCGIREVLYNMLINAEISLISGIAGEVEEVLDAFLSDRLHEPHFHMPGYKANHSLN